MNSKNILQYFKLLIFTLVISFVVSCSSKKEIKNKLETIDLVQGIKNDQDVTLSQLADDIVYIPLETTPECLIQKIEKIKFWNNLLIVGETDNVLVFNNQGHFMNRIGSIGKAAGEYLYIDDITVDENGDVIILEGGRRKVIRYSIDGRFLNEWNIEHYPRSIAVQDSFIYLAWVKPEYYYNDMYSINQYTGYGVLISKDLKHEASDLENIKIDATATTGRVRFEYFDDSLSFWEVNSDYLYRISESGKASARYYFYNETAKPKSEVNSTVIDPTAYQFSYVLETTKYIFFLFGIYQNHAVHLYYDKTSHECKNFTYQSRSLREELEFGFMNDIDGGYPFLPHGIKSNNELYTTVYGSHLKKLIEEGTWINNYDQSKFSELMYIIEKSTLNDNPIVMIVKMKTE